MKLKCHQCTSAYLKNKLGCPYCYTRNLLSPKGTLREEELRSLSIYHEITVFCCISCRYFYITTEFQPQQSTSSYCCSQEECQDLLVFRQKTFDIQEFRYGGAIKCHASSVKVADYGKRFSYKKELGKGGNAEVLEFYDNHLQRSVAIKIPLDKRQNSLIEAEAKITAFLEHPNILPIYDFGKNSHGEAFFAMKKLEPKKNLMSISSKNEVEILSTFLQVCHAIDFSHSQNIIHLDLKPENILLGEHGEVIVSDWGVATFYAERCHKFVKGAVIGTIAYMPPEQLTGDPQYYQKACDIYALGAILFSLLTGQPPSVRRNKDLCWEKDALQIPSGKLSRPLHAIIQVATHPQAEKRYSSVHELISDIQSYLSEKDGAAFRQPWYTKLRRNISHHPKLFSVSISLFAFLLLAFSFFSVQYSRIYYECFYNFQNDQLLAAKKNYRDVQDLFSFLGRNFPLVKYAYYNEEFMENYLKFATDMEKIRFAFFRQYIKSETQENKTEHMIRLGSEMLQRLKKMKTASFSTDLRIQNYLKKTDFSKAKEELNSLLLLSKKFRGVLVSHQEAATLFSQMDQKIPANFKQPHQAVAFYFATQNWQKISDFTYENPHFYWGHYVHSIELFNKSDYKATLLATNTCLALQKKPELHHNRGSCFYYLEQYKQARQEYEKALSLDKHYIAAYLHLAILFRKLKEYNLALQYLDQAIALNPNSQNLYNSRGLVYQDLKLWPRSRQDFQKAIELSPRNPSFFNNRAVSYLKGKEYNKALADFGKAIHLNPKYYKAYSNRGSLYTQRGQYDEAMEDLYFVTNQFRGYLPAYINRSLVHLKQKKYSLALSDIEYVLKKDPTIALAYHVKGSIFQEQKKYRLAIKSFEKALELDSELVEAYTSLANTFDNLGKSSQAQELYVKALQLDPKNSDIHYNLGYCYEKGKEYDKALSQYTKAIELDPFSAMFFDERGSVYFYQKLFSHAQADFLEAIKLDPLYPNAYSNLATLFSYLGKYSFAIEYFDKAIELRPNFLLAHINRGYAYYQLKEYEKALEDWKKFLNIEKYPAFQEELCYCFYQQAKSYVEQGKIEAGIHSLSKAIENGFDNISLLDKDPKLQILKKRTSFQKLLQDLEKKNERNKKNK